MSARLSLVTPELARAYSALQEHERFISARIDRFERARVRALLIAMIGAFLVVAVEPDRPQLGAVVDVLVLAALCALAITGNEVDRARHQRDALMRLR